MCLGTLLGVVVYTSWLTAVNMEISVLHTIFKLKFTSSAKTERPVLNWSTEQHECKAMDLGVNCKMHLLVQQHQTIGLNALKLSRVAVKTKTSIYIPNCDSSYTLWFFRILLLASEGDTLHPVSFESVR